MPLAPNAKRKPARRKANGPKLSIAEWLIEPSTPPGEVNLSFVAVQESSGNVSRLTTRRFLLRCERAEELVKELKEVLEDFAATRRLEEQAASEAPGFTSEADSTAGRAVVEDTEMLSNHFALGAYGLVGN